MSDEPNTNIVFLLGEIKSNLAVNTTKTTAIEEHLKTLNGKVAAHESRLQVTEGHDALSNQLLQQVVSQLNEKKSEKRDWVDWGMKALIALTAALFYWLLTTNGFPKFL
jgi:hypothetical protein